MGGEGGHLLEQSWRESERPPGKERTGFVRRGCAPGCQSQPPAVRGSTSCTACCGRGTTRSVPSLGSSASGGRPGEQASARWWGLGGRERQQSSSGSCACCRG